MPSLLTVINGMLNDKATRGIVSVQKKATVEEVKTLFLEPSTATAQIALPALVSGERYHNPRLDPKNFLEGPLSTNASTRLRQMLARPGIVVRPLTITIAPILTRFIRSRLVFAMASVRAARLKLVLTASIKGTQASISVNCFLIVLQWRGNDSVSTWPARRRHCYSQRFH